MEIRSIAFATCWATDGCRSALWAKFGGIFTHFAFAIADGFIERNRAAHQKGIGTIGGKPARPFDQALRAGWIRMDGTHH